MVELIKNYKNIQVLTDLGWSNFKGLLCKGAKKTLRVNTNLEEIICTPNHEFFLEGFKKIKAEDLTSNTKIISSNGIVNVIDIVFNKDEEVYDLCEVEKNHRFYANNLLVSNCEFLIYDETLIDSMVLSNMRGRDTLFRQGTVRWFKKPTQGKCYIIALDPSLGTGGDPAAIQVFDVPSMEQVAEWQHNKTPIPQQVQILMNICKYINEETKEENNIYYSVENNTLGEAALVSIADIGEENIPGTFISESKRSHGNSRLFRKGFNTTQRVKLSTCAKLKTLVETGKMTINSKNLISEFKTFIANGASYSAKLGETDDLVMSTVLVIRIANELKNYVLELDMQIRDTHDYDISPMPFVVF